MEDLFFWKRWSKDRQVVLFSLLFLAFCSIIFLVSGWVLGNQAILSWTTSPEFKAVYTPIDNFVQHLIHYTVDINSFLVREAFAVAPPEIHPISSYIYLSLTVTGFLFILTSITFLDFFQFAFGIALFVIFLVTLQTELLGIFGHENRGFLILAIALYLPLGYYFQAFNKTSGYFQRLLAFLGITVLLGIVPAITSSVPYPYFHIANFSILVPVIVAILFMAITGYDLIQLFLYLVTNGKSTNPSGRLLNFVLVSLLYLINLFMALADRLGYFGEGMLYISPFIIYLCSSIAGLWLFKRKLQGTAMSFVPGGAFYYIGCMLISNAVIGLAFVTANDPMVEMFEYIIIYTYSAFGLIYFFYVLINFGDLFNKNVQIYKVVYQPRRSPYFIMQGISAVIILALFLQANRFPYFLGMAGYYNLCGDVYSFTKNDIIAAEYYKNGYLYAFQNHRSNYALGSLALTNNDQRAAQERFTQALTRNPSAYAYVQLSNIYRDANMFFPSLFMLQDGIKEFPDNPHLANNLGLLSEKAGSVDSAFIYLNQAASEDNIRSIASANMLALLIDRKLFSEADSLSQSIKISGSGFLSNQLLTGLLNRSVTEVQIPVDRQPKDSVLSGADFAFWYNYGLSRIHIPDDTVFSHLEKLASTAENHSYKKHLETIIALNKWYTGNKFDAIRQFDILRSSNAETAPYYNKLAGMLLFRQRSYHNAAEFLKAAHQGVDQEAMLYYAISLIEARDYQAGIEWLNKLQASELGDVRMLAENLLRILNTKEIQTVKNWDDALKYQYLHFNLRRLNENERFQLFEEIRDDNIRTLSIAELLKDYLDQGEITKARRIASMQTTAPENDSYYIAEFNLQYMRLLAEENRWQELAIASRELKLNDYASDNAILFEARALSQLGDTGAAEMLYDRGLTLNPFNATANVYASEFYEQKGNSEKAYDILVTGLELNPGNIPLLKAYIQIATKLNLDAFANDALEVLRKVLPASDYKAFSASLNNTKD